METEIDRFVGRKFQTQRTTCPGTEVFVTQRVWLMLRIKTSQCILNERKMRKRMELDDL